MRQLLWSRWVDPIHPASSESDRFDSPGMVTHRVSITPMGVMSAEPRSFLADVYSMWIGRLTTDLTDEDIDQIAAVPGVEILRPLTRYAFLMGVGPQFEADTVKDGVHRVICPRAPTRLSLLERGLRQIYHYWAVLTGPNAAYECVGGDNTTEINQILAEYGEEWQVVSEERG